MSPSENAIEEFIDYITDRNNIRDVSKWIEGRTMSGKLGEVEYHLRVRYMLGTAYMHGIIGKKAFTVEMFYCRYNGFSFSMKDGDLLIHESEYLATELNPVKAFLTLQASI